MENYEDITFPPSWDNPLSMKCSSCKHEFCNQLMNDWKGEKNNPSDSLRCGYQFKYQSKRRCCCTCRSWGPSLVKKYLAKCKICQHECCGSVTVVKARKTQSNFSSDIFTLHCGFGVCCKCKNTNNLSYILEEVPEDDSTRNPKKPFFFKNVFDFDDLRDNDSEQFENLKKMSCDERVNLLKEYEHQGRNGQYSFTFSVSQTEKGKRGLEGDGYYEIECPFCPSCLASRSDLELIHSSSAHGYGGSSCSWEFECKKCNRFVYVYLDKAD